MNSMKPRIVEPNVKMLNGQAQSLLSMLWSKRFTLRQQIENKAITPVAYADSMLRIEDQADAIVQMVVGANKPIADIDHTSCSYCASCTRDFEHLEFVHYVVWDNDCVCTTCSKTINAEKEPRIYVGDSDE